MGISSNLIIQSVEKASGVSLGRAEYVSPILTRHGSVQKLTESGNTTSIEAASPANCSQDNRRSCR
jgi:hypothetical protein